jgi:hypothetical protein
MPIILLIIRVANRLEVPSKDNINNTNNTPVVGEVNRGLRFFILLLLAMPLPIVADAISTLTLL